MMGLYTVGGGNKPSWIWPRLGNTNFFSPSFNLQWDRVNEKEKAKKEVRQNILE